MSERYIRIFSGDKNLYLDGAPIVIRASALLKDTETGKMIGQLKFKNLSGKKISYLKVSILQLDALKNPIGDAISFEYLDISVPDKEEFGSKKPIYLPNSSVRSFNICGCDIAFDDGSVWTSDNSTWVSASNDSSVVKEITADETYKKALELYQTNNIENLQYAITLFERIQDQKDVFYEIEACNKKIVEIEQRSIVSKIKKIISKMRANKATLAVFKIISKMRANKATLAVFGVLFVVLLFWIIFSFVCAAKTHDLALEHISTYNEYNIANEVIDEFESYKQYTLPKAYYGIAQFVMLIIAFVLPLFIQNVSDTVYTVSRIILSLLIFGISLISLLLYDHPNPFYTLYGFYFESVVIFNILICIISILLTALFIFKIKKTKTRRGN